MDSLEAVIKRQINRTIYNEIQLINWLLDSSWWFLVDLKAEMFIAVILDGNVQGVQGFRTMTGHIGFWLRKIQNLSTKKIFLRK